MFRQLYSESKILLNSFRTLNLKQINHNLNTLPLKQNLSYALDSYREHLETKTPMLTTVLSITSTYAIGQGLSQIISQSYSLTDLAIYTAYGPIGGLCYYYWFKVLDKVPGEMLVKSNAYQDLFFKKVPQFLKNRLDISLSRDVFITDAKIKGHLSGQGYELNDGTKVPVTIPEGTEIALNALKITPKRIENVNKWSLKFTKIFMDQFIFSSVYTAFLMVTIGLFSGKNLGEIGHLLDTSFWTIFKMDCMIWPFIQFINFSYIPRAFQPIAVNVANVGWNTYIALVLGAVH